MNITTIIREVRVRIANEYDRAELFRREGAEIGQGCRLLVTSLGSEPYLIAIGDETLVAGGVSFLTHDAGSWVFRREHPETGRFGRITIGSRVFIGQNAIILLGVTIGDGAIVGAGAVVTKDVPAGMVVAGVPARVVNTVADYERRTLRDFPALDAPVGGPKGKEDLRRQLEIRYPRG